MKQADIIETMCEILEVGWDNADVQRNMTDEISVLRKAIDDALAIAAPNRK